MDCQLMEGTILVLTALLELLKKEQRRPSLTGKQLRQLGNAFTALLAAIHNHLAGNQPTFIQRLMETLSGKNEFWGQHDGITIRDTMDEANVQRDEWPEVHAMIDVVQEKKTIINGPEYDDGESVSEIDGSEQREATGINAAAYDRKFVATKIDEQPAA